MAVLLAELRTSVPGVTVNRLCGSSLEAAIQKERACDQNRRCERRDRGRRGVHDPRAMSRAQAAQGFPAGGETLHSTTLGWRMVNPAMPEA
jgi:acetyl-CoA acyltransferase